MKAVPGNQLAAEQDEDSPSNSAASADMVPGSALAAVQGSPALVTSPFKQSDPPPPIMLNKDQGNAHRSALPRPSSLGLLPMQLNALSRENSEMFPG